jgi:alpha-L-arabinofuranosidase
MLPFSNRPLWLALLALAPASTLPAQAALTLSVDVTAPGKPISPDLFGIFFEDINYSADGGLYAELIQNRSFEYSPLARREWTNLTAWELTPRGGRGDLDVDGAFPLHANNPHYAVLSVRDTGEVALVNEGFDGVALRADEDYRLSFFARRLYAGGRWDGKKSASPLPLVARLETREGAVLAETSFVVTEDSWQTFSATLKSNATTPAARLVLIARERGGLALDEVSLFPAKTFRAHPNGLRADLAQTIADLRPRFIRFPGGCLVHGNGIPNFYRWKDTIGPVEQRRQQANLWGYHQTVGLGYFEYFQFCEDIGARALPVVPAGVSCQNSGHTGGTGQQCLPLAEMGAYIQDVLDLIEWANGPSTSTWGAKRAAAGHPAPFGLKYLGVGNEDHITPGFHERFELIQRAIQARHPEIVVIGTVGPAPDGEDFERGWRLADELRVPMVDEHYYKSPDWFWANLARYDAYDRSRAKVYVGEYAAHDDKRRSTLRAALAEAAHLTALERNGDVVTLASYAPLLAKRGRTQWTPDLIYFDNTNVYPTLSYEVQRLFGNNAVATVLPSTLRDAPTNLAFSTARDSAGDLVLKLVNGASTPRQLRIELVGFTRTSTPAELTVLAHPDANVANEDARPPAAVTLSQTITVSPTFEHELPAHSLTIIRIPHAP